MVVRIDGSHRRGHTNIDPSTDRSQRAPAIQPCTNQTTNAPESWMTSPSSSSLVMAPLHEKFFLNACGGRRFSVVVMVVVLGFDHLACVRDNKTPFPFFPTPKPQPPTTTPTHKLTHALTFRIRFTSRSSASPATVVMHLRPFRCCTRMCTLDESRACSLASRKGSDFGGGFGG